MMLEWRPHQRDYSELAGAIGATISARAGAQGPPAARQGWNDKHKVTANRVRLKQGLGRALRSPEDKAVVIWTHTGVSDRLGLNPRTGRVT